MALPGPGDRVRLDPGRLRHGLPVLRHRPGGFTRHLTAGEIVEQVVGASGGPAPGSPTWSSWAWGSRWPTTTACGRAVSAARRDRDLGPPPHVSTVGWCRHPPPGRRGAAGQPGRVPPRGQRQLRDELVPINRRYPLAELAEACAAYVDASRRRLSIEWALIDGVNDRGRTRPSSPPSRGRLAPTSTSSRSTRRRGTRSWALRGPRAAFP